MKIIQLLFLIVLIVPFIEIYLLLQVGGVIGALPTILLVVATAVLGAFLLKQQGLATFQRFQVSLAQGEVPAYEMIEGPIILLGGALLLTPGFLTDILGIACLIPSLRRRIAQYILENHLIQAVNGGFGQGKPADRDVLEGEFRKED
ncbi:MAG: FxsA family protein [Methylovulum sp.]|uniref:FxsA family protein n=1 Tax=Methylovulum sp. TaxID=1916980 RepID=UPI002618FB97|nr:FxsA family protein [Methylovulum sp.]MDD2723240.1 FxsA family protein [Methylovulum sp.]MDD5123439.1 FxsA family protein [Methylovulum sp.]